MKHSPLIGLATARRRYILAQEICPHWDYESDGDSYTCCHELRVSEAAYKKLRKACRHFSALDNKARG